MMLELMALVLGDPGYPGAVITFNDFYRCCDIEFGRYLLSYDSKDENLEETARR